jgi:4-hydroxy-tetrahydrodipicolinate synthase
MSEKKAVHLGIVTPFTRDNQVDVEGIRKNLDFYLSSGVHSIEPTSTSGEGSLLSVEEYEKVVRTTVDHVNGKVPVLAGTPGSTPDSIIRLAKLAKNIGVDGAYLSTPAYTMPTQEGLFAHFSKILSSVDIQFVIYNAVHRSGVDLSPEIVVRLANEFSNFSAYKEPSLAKAQKIMGLLGRRLSILVEDWLFVPGLVIGASGVQTVVGSVVPQMVLDMYDKFVEGEIEEAAKIQIQLYPLIEILGSGAGGTDPSPAPIKAAMNMIGLAGGDPRLPILPASTETRKRLRTLLAGLPVKLMANSQ